MHNIEPTVDYNDIICADTVAEPSAMVVFGASGDLAQRKLVASLYGLYEKKLLNEKFFLIGCSRTKLSDDEFRMRCKKSILSVHPDLNPDELNVFLSKFYYLSGQYDDQNYYQEISRKLDALSSKYKLCGCFVYYLSTPPTLFPVITGELGKSGLSYGGCADSCKKSRIVIEKPFGRDTSSSRELNAKIREYFDEHQIYRIDHYLGKETVQNILMFRFANSIFEPLWNRNYIDHIQITIAESLGVEGRYGYYDSSGVLRDMFQNHMIQLLSLVAMEPPVAFEADSIRDEKSRVVNALRDFKEEQIDELFVRGQYSSGNLDGKDVCGYREENELLANSNTETFLACKLMIDNWRWKDVPFYLRSGKRLKKKTTEIAITFKEVPHSMFSSVGIDKLTPNTLVLKIQPCEGTSLSFQTKRPGSKACMATLTMDYDYQEIFGTQMPEAYERLLLDCMVGDQTLFSRFDCVDKSWQYFDKVLAHWKKSGQAPYLYNAGSESFEEADALIKADSRQWRSL